MRRGDSMHSDGHVVLSEQTRAEGDSAGDVGGARAKTRTGFGERHVIFRWRIGGGVVIIVTVTVSTSRGKELLHFTSFES